MEQFIQVGGRKYPLTEEQAVALLGQIRKKDAKLADFKPGDTVWIGPWEFVVLEQLKGETALILRGLLQESVVFGKSNRYDGSDADEICCAFAKQLADEIGEESLTEFAVDLTTDDGLRDYGSVLRKAALLTTEQYRKYVEVLDLEILDKWWWLATAASGKRHGNETWVKCVSPRGGIVYGGIYYYDCIGVRPFCILKSHIFVS